jgi:hypothetical protein
MKWMNVSGSTEFVTVTNDDTSITIAQLNNTAILMYNYIVALFTTPSLIYSMLKLDNA